MQHPVVMGILNTTPDSFYLASRVQQKDAILYAAQKMVSQGARILDIGGISTRPGAKIVKEEEELRRVLPAVVLVRQYFPDIIISVDTFRAKIAQAVLQAGAHIINDISAGNLDPDLLPLIAQWPNVPYILMHMQGTPQNMQQNPFYDDVVAEVARFFCQKITELHQLGVYDIIIDPGFGFGKTLQHNYTLLKHLHSLIQITQGKPLLAGVSRKSMVTRLLKISPQQALNGTTALHILALQAGASILRVHDVKPAMQAIAIFEAWQQG
ncbi:MAG TPA: dihydropteroate synthase [Chitinophagales bacterium]|nr:dihydropteroate synthase [Chitinophagales bacterium]